MSLKLAVATPADVEVIAALRNATADHLTAQYGKGPWSGHCTAKGVLFNLRHEKIFVVHRRGKIVASLVLATKKPWAIDRAYFSKVELPLYLLAMAVQPELQRQGIGRRCVEAAAKIARRWPADAIFLDAFDHPAAGAGGFYARCGFRETGRAVYRETPLIYYELLLS